MLEGIKSWCSNRIAPSRSPSSAPEPPSSREIEARELAEFETNRLKESTLRYRLQLQDQEPVSNH